MEFSGNWWGGVAEVLIVFTLKPRSADSIPRPLALAMLLALLGSVFSARAEPTLPYSAWSDAEAFRAPPRRAPVERPAPKLVGRALERRELELGLQAGVAHKLCSADVERCDNSAGLALSVRGSARPVPLFVWGLSVQHATFTESLSVSGLELTLKDRTTWLSLFGRIHPNATGVFDPFVEFGSGGGSVAERGTLALANNGRIVIDHDTLAPLLHVGAGLDLHVSSRVRFGAQFQWTHWLLSSHERCRGVAFGACTLPSYGHFDVENAVWSWNLGSTISFGAQH